MTLLVYHLTKRVLINNTMNNPFKVDILAFGAHPDDVELGCGGTLAKLIHQGKSAAIVDLTRGEMGTRGTIETRHEEAMKAMEILGISYRQNLNMKDGFLEHTAENIRRIVEMVRKYQPEMVFGNAIEDRHPDHAKAQKMVSDACFISGLIKYETEYEGEKQTHWRPKQVFNYIQWKEITPDFVIDISDFMEQKIASCMAYATQFYDPSSQEPETLIATKNFQESLTYRAQNLGRLTGCDYAEGFTSEKILALKNFETIIL